MKFLDDILQAVSGSTKTKIEDPFIGAFIGSWIICNWDRLALLVWGEGTAAGRIDATSKYYRELKIWDFNSLMTIPLLMTGLFIFAFPWVSLGLKSLLKSANERLHQQAVSVEISKIQQQETLNKQKLLADPDKEFLGQNLKLDIERRSELIEQLKLRKARLKEKADAAKAASETALFVAAAEKSRAVQVELEEEKKRLSAELEKQRFGVLSAQLKSEQASNRFPSAYSFMLKIEESLKGDGIKLSLAGLGEIVAMVFGYDSFYSLVHDEKFNNKNLSQVSYIYFDREKFASVLETIVQNENSESEDLDSDTLFEHVIMIFDDSECKLLSHDQVEEICREVCEKFKYDLLDSNELSGPIAESDTIYDDVEIGDLEDITFDNGLSVTFSGLASGNHRKEYDISGRDIEFSIEIKSAVIVGTQGLADFERGEVSANLVDYGYEPEHEEDEP